MTELENLLLFLELKGPYVSVRKHHLQNWLIKVFFLRKY